MADWTDTTWGAVATLKYGKALPGERGGGSTEVFGTNGAIGWTDHPPLFSGPKPVVGRKGAYRGVHLARGNAWVIDTAYWLEPGGDVDPLWAYHALRGADINGLGSGSAIPSTSRDDFYSMPVRIPPLREQRAIAEVLGALDDKIAANDRVIRNADSLASATYRSLLSNRSETSLTTLADFVNGKAFTKGASGTGRVVIRIAELNSGVGGSTVYSDADVDGRYLARPGDILFAWSGSLTLHRWFQPEGIVNQHIFKVIPKAPAPKWLIWCAIADRLEYFKGVAADKATTMGHIQRRHLEEAVVVPAPEKVTGHDSFMTALWDRALAAEQESLQLVTMRDALLPALMSGALRVKDAERLAEDLTWTD